jgi:hypothetical protein
MPRLGTGLPLARMPLSSPELVFGAWSCLKQQLQSEPSIYPRLKFVEKLMKSASQVGSKSIDGNEKQKSPQDRNEDR